MSLRVRITLALGLVIAVCMVLATSILRGLVYPIFDDLEISVASGNLARASMALDSIETYLVSTNKDWAWWTDTYLYVQGKNPAFEEMNLYIAVNTEIDIDVVAFFDLEGNLVASRIFDVPRDETPTFEEIFGNRLSPESSVLRHDHFSDVHAGLIMTRRGPMFLTSATVLNDDAKGVTAGSMVMGRFLRSARIGEAARQAGIEFSLASLDSADWSPNERTLLAELAASGEPAMHRRSEAGLFSYQVRRDIYGKPGFAIRSKTSGDITSAGMNALQLALILLGMTGILFAASVWVLIRRVVLRPLGSLTDQILGIRRSGDLNQRIALARSDEIGTLAEQFDALTGELDAAQQQMAIARDEALDLAQLKSEFLATMSHEIRTPMNGVIGMADLLMTTDLDEKQTRFASTIQHSADGLLSIINDILDFSKLDAGKVELEMREFDLRELIEEVSMLFAASCQEKGLELACVVPPELDALYRGDSNRLRQIITNLLGNAIKFTERGEVALAVSARTDSEGVELLLFEVRDTGVGIPSEQQGRIFESFSQADASTTRKFGGTGLGLAISKQLILLMAGQLGVDSEPSKGSTFWFEVPIERVGRPNRGPSHDAPELQGRKILVVDDNATNLEVIEHQLEAWGMRCTAVLNGRDALISLSAAVSEKRPFEVVILDMHMPDMDGMAVARAIRADAPIAQVPMVLLSSVMLTDEGEEEGPIDFHAHLVKPVRQAELLRCVSGALGGPVVARAQKAIVEAMPPEIDRSNRSARLLLVEDNEVNQLVALAILDKLGYQVDLANHGKEALEAMANAHYDAVLMDCQMPIMDGYQATAEIRRREAASGEGRRTTIIALTANAIEGDREKCLEAQMDDYLGKPFRQADILQVLDRWLSPSREDSPEIAASHDSTTAESGEPAIDFAALDALRRLESPEQPTRVADAIETYRSDSNALLEDLHDAVTEGDLEALERACQALKSSSLGVGARTLAAMSEEVETLSRQRTLDNAKDRVDQIDRETRRVLDALAAYSSA